LVFGLWFFVYRCIRSDAGLLPSDLKIIDFWCFASRCGLTFLRQVPTASSDFGSLWFLDHRCIPSNLELMNSVEI